MNTSGRWQKLGRIIAPDEKIVWRKSFTGPSFAKQNSTSQIEIYCTGRDEKNRSQVGHFNLEMGNHIKIVKEATNPVFERGERGAFDDAGVSYPWIVETPSGRYMYYVGWMKSVDTPFQNHMGLAKFENGRWTRVSRAPIFERTDFEPFCVGSMSVLVENDLWRMWYTSFDRWGNEGSDQKHFYNIKYAESADGIRWVRKNKVCINYADDTEYAIGRPSVLIRDGIFHMWFSVRGRFYKIGYARSSDGIQWERRDDLARIELSPAGWDSQSICYSHVFTFNSDLYMIYNGNNYGKEGLGLAKWVDL